MAGADLVVANVSKRFGARVRALEDVSLTVGAGEFASLTGPSGSGKSTLLNIVAGFDEPDTGCVTVDGVPVPEISDSARYRREVIGFVFQLHHLMSALTAEENVEVPLIPTVSARRERSRRAREALAEVGLGTRSDHLPAQLSGGERQRVAIARALIGAPKLLLADEPTGALDSQASLEILRLLRRVCDHHGTTILLVSHDPEATEHADHIIGLRDGKVVSDEPRLATPTRRRAAVG
jgi:putative ABC transport system ATP-binding protein